MTDKLEALQKKFCKLSFDIKSNSDGLSSELFNKMNADLYAAYVREYEYLNCTEGLEADTELAALKRERLTREAEFNVLDKTLREEIAIKTAELLPEYKRHWIFWKRPNKAMELTIAAATAQIYQYFTARESDVEAQEIRAGAAPAELSGRIHDILINTLPMPKGKKKRAKREKTIETLCEMLCRTTQQEQCSGDGESNSEEAPPATDGALRL